MSRGCQWDRSVTLATCLSSMLQWNLMGLNTLSEWQCFLLDANPDCNSCDGLAHLLAFSVAVVLLFTALVCLQGCDTPLASAMVFLIR
jgi:hypothetical protein